jgi:hypothetical protein
MKSALLISVVVLTVLAAGAKATESYGTDSVNFAHITASTPSATWVQIAVKSPNPQLVAFDVMTNFILPTGDPGSSTVTLYRPDGLWVSGWYKLPAGANVQMIMVIGKKLADYKCAMTDGQSAVTPGKVY